MITISETFLIALKELRCTREFLGHRNFLCAKGNQHSFIRSFWLTIFNLKCFAKLPFLCTKSPKSLRKITAKALKWSLRHSGTMIRGVLRSSMISTFHPKRHFLMKAVYFLRDFLFNLKLQASFQFTLYFFVSFSESWITSPETLISVCDNIALDATRFWLVFWVNLFFRRALFPL